MRVSLESDAEFVKQIADLRWFLYREDAKGGQAAATSRFLTVSYVPYLEGLRTELRGRSDSDHQVDPEVVMTAVAALIGNLAMTLVQSMFDAPAQAQEKALDLLLARAKTVAMRASSSIIRMAPDAKPKLAVLN